MKTDTPRTDQEIQRCTIVHFITESDDDGYGVKANFARKLERELTAVTEQRDRLAEALEQIIEEDGVPMSMRASSPKSLAKHALQFLTQSPNNA